MVWTHLDERAKLPQCCGTGGETANISHRCYDGGFCSGGAAVLNIYRHTHTLTHAHRHAHTHTPTLTHTIDLPDQGQV